MKKAIVFGSGFVALGAVRALSLEGIEVILLSTGGYDFARFSKYVHKSFKVPSPEKDAPKLIEFLMHTNEDWDGALLLPADDNFVVFTSKNRELLSERYVPAPQPWSIMGKIIDKKYLYQESHKINIPAPKVIYPKSMEDLSLNKMDLSYPCILKPFMTPAFKEVFNKKVLVVNSFGELTEKFEEVCKHKLEVMISEIIPGADNDLSHYRSYIDDQGEVLAEMCTQKIRQHPPEFGMACAAKTIPMNNDMKESALKLLRHLSYRGESSVEFKLDKRDNKYKLMEINVRPVLPESHFVAAGINFPYTTYLDLVEKVKLRKSDYRKDFYWINNFTDTREFFRALWSGNLNFKEFITPYRREKVFCVPFFDDPLPFLMTGLKIINGIGSLFNRIYSSLDLQTKPLKVKEMK